MGDGFTLASVLGTVASVEKSALYGDEGIVVVAKLLFSDHLEINDFNNTGNSRLQEPSSVTVDDGNSSGIRNRNMFRLNANEFSIFLMHIMNGKVTNPLSSLPEKPKVRKSCRERCIESSEFLCVDNVW